MTRPFDRLRDSLAHLSRADLRSLASEAGCSRDDLTDFAEAGVVPSTPIIEKLEAWHSVHSLRAALNDARRIPMIADITRACEIALPDYEAFRNGDAELPAEAMARLRDFLLGKYSQSGTSGSFLRTASAPDVLPAFRASAELPAETRRRAHLMHALRDLPLAELERLVTTARKAA